MCGIAGVMTRSGAAPSPALLDALARSLIHRGPDGEGRQVEGNVGLVHRRLAIIDLEGGWQPLYGPDNSGLSLVANGEIYNYRELTARFPDHRFRTASDCELPLHLYADHGLDFVEHLRGMYAIALLDAHKQRLILTRDPFGIKPLYYAETEAGFAFASEPQCLIAAGWIGGQGEPRKLAELLNLQFTTGDETPFARIKRVLPGEMLVIEGGRIVARRARPALPATEHEEEELDEASALARLDALWAETVELHQRADVPYGMFLSGGVDSSAVLAMMKRLNPQPVRAYTIGFSGTQARDERAHAAQVAKAAGAHHIEVDFTDEDFWTLLPEVAAAMDDPAADYACLPTYKLAREARKDVTVILSGEGGDELFGGYGRYRGAMRPWPFTRPMRRKGTFDGLKLYGTALLRPEFAALPWRAGMAAAEKTAHLAGGSRLQQAQTTDIADWLPNDLLGKLDRCLMAHGMEGRVPFLDPVLAAFAFPLSDKLKIRDGRGKYLLRRWLAQALPESEPFSAKRGFTVPVGEFLARRPQLGEILARDPGLAEFAQPDSVRALFRDLPQRSKELGFAAWSLTFTALWHRRHLRGLLPQGDILDTLSAG